MKSIRRKVKILGLLLLLPGAAYSQQAESIQVDGYAAMVNDRVITVGDVLMQMQPVEQQLRTMYEGRELEEKLEEAFDETREALIERALILEDFENESKQDLPERVIDDRMNEIIHNTFNDDRAEFLRALSQQRMTIAEWREQLKEQIIIAILRRQEILDRVSVSPKAVYEVYQARSKEYSRPAMVKLRRIVIRVGATEEEQQVKRAEVEEVYRKLAAGEAFDALANTVSEDVRAARGGDWGWRNPDELNARLAEAISALKPGEYSEIVEVGDAFYILQVEGIKEASSVPFEDVRQEIEEQLEQEQKERLYQSWMERLRDKYFIKIF